MTHLIQDADPDWLLATDIRFTYPWGEQIREVAKGLEGIGFVAGGAARFVLVPDVPDPSDIDVWMLKEWLDLEPLYHLGYYELGEATGTRRFKHTDHELLVQVILPSSARSNKSWGTPMEVLKTFTFTTEQAALWYSASGAAGLLSVAGRVDTESRVIRNNSITNPILSLYRLNKYGQKGYQVSMETLLEITTTLHRLSRTEYADAVTIATSVQS